ncbi:30S ribosomal protein S17 [Candidatus Parcubacteria bacterium]|nr:30S ribosomal protein S17 [Patescibacteria group bacterium]MBU4381143.1 30S ribosomal protein S17 [Patescibacteria group bacterium]MCG2689134.1 30S ribosomal protein S17 [Candidatus Parcubacteria bacterium]
MPKKTFVGKIVSDKMQKTAIVAVEMPRKDPMYGKEIRNTRRFKAHNEVGAKLGDFVTIEESRPLSCFKNWVVTKIN